MKTLLAAFFLLVPLGFASATAQETTSERIRETASEIWQETKEAARDAAAVVKETSRKLWKQSEAYLSKDPDAYRKGAGETLADLEREIASLEADAKTGALAGRGYFATRVQALRQQHQFASSQLAEVRKMQGDASGAQTGLNRTIDHLEAALNQAQSEANDFRAAAPR